MAASAKHTSLEMVIYFRCARVGPTSTKHVNALITKMILGERTVPLHGLAITLPFRGGGMS